MTDNKIIFKSGTIIKNERFGKGRVELDKGETVIIRFEHGIEECDKKTLREIFTPIEAVKGETWHSPLEVITKAQAYSIRSVNESWGIFSLSRIALLPHQLWVCRQVISKWPTRYLIADDVGLGKTIEVGLILWPLLSNGRVKRLLILCPASLVQQWQYRLRTMFDIRLTQYCPEADSDKTDFWNIHSQVVASIQTLRMDRNNRHNRFLNSSPWDLIIVDESHHLNADEQTGHTLGYELINRLVKDKRVTSLLFLTGTPHRGKNYNFLALLKLLRPDLFDPRKPIQEQLLYLKQVMIRNNKQNVTDLHGNRLFHPPVVSEQTYKYSPEESKFYNMLTEFILTGKAYASSLTSTDARTVYLVLITMQKLASSSVAAIRRALRGRLEKIVEQKRKIEKLKKCQEQNPQKLYNEYEEMEKLGYNDEISIIEQELLSLTAGINLMENEELRLRELIQAADEVKEETKINKIISILKTRFANRSVLFFTEYKATQSLLMSSIMKHFGDSCVTFINGDEKADEVVDNSGKVRTINEYRQKASEKFNTGKVSFLISTEAGGEGIDLQEKCYSLIHVDLPWNPMRLHQRIGRLNRYGQKYQVEVINLRNPDTVESRIWDKLQDKIQNIMMSLSQVMEEPEDLLQLVLGMTSSSLFRELFSDAINVPRESLSKWFDQKTSSFGGRDVIDMVKELVGHCTSFDFQQISPNLPRLDLPDLTPFFETMLILNHRRVRKENDGLSFKTPENWLNEPGIYTSYENMIFDRQRLDSEAKQRILGIGHKLIEQALKQALDSTTCVTTISKTHLKNPIIIFNITDRITEERSSVRSMIAAIEVTVISPYYGKILRDWELLRILNDLSTVSWIHNNTSESPEDKSSIITVLEKSYKFLETQYESLDIPFKFPASEILAIIWPSS